MLLVGEEECFLLVTKGGGRELTDKLVSILHVFVACLLSLVQCHHRDGIRLLVRQGGADSTLTECCIEGRESCDFELIGEVGVNGGHGTIVVHQGDDLSVLVDERATYGVVRGGV